MKDLTFGQYYPTDSAIHKMDARVKLILLTVYIVAIFFIKSYFGYVIATALVVIMSIASKVPLPKILKSVKRILFIVVFTALLNLFFIKDGNILCSWWIFKITDNGVNFAIMMALRLVLLVIGTTFLTLTTTPMALTDGIESLLKPLKYIKVPVHDIAVIMSIALRFIPTLVDETNKIINAQKARGANFDTGNIFARAKALLPVLIPLFVSSFRRADELALALDSRCYNATPNRTKMKVQKVSYRDVIAFLVVAGVLALIIVDRFVWLGVF